MVVYCCIKITLFTHEQLRNSCYRMFQMSSQFQLLFQIRNRLWLHTVSHKLRSIKITGKQIIWYMNYIHIFIEFSSVFKISNATCQRTLLSFVPINFETLCPIDIQFLEHVVLSTCLVKQTCITVFLPISLPSKNGTTNVWNISFAIFHQ